MDLGDAHNQLFASWWSLSPFTTESRGEKPKGETNNLALGSQGSFMRADNSQSLRDVHEFVRAPGKNSTSGIKNCYMPDEFSCEAGEQGFWGSRGR